MTDCTVEKPSGWIFYDAECSLCVRGRQKTGRLFESRGFEWLPLQTPGAALRLSVPESAFDIRMHLLLADGRVLHNADALGVMCRSVWWLWPIGLLLLVPGFREIGRLSYDWFARNRHCVGGACRLTGRKLPGAWIPLLILPAIALAFRNALPAWVFMWLLAFSLFFACRWLTLAMAIRSGARTSSFRSASYLLAWVGMDAKSFLGTYNKTHSHSPSPLVGERVGVRGIPSSELLFALAKTLFGVALIWLGAPLATHIHPLLCGWVGMIGVVFLLHFGCFHLLSLGWRSLGVNAPPIMRAPLLSRSVAEFWGKRWNVAFHELVHRFTFRPVSRSLGVLPAMLMVFFVSGLIHDLLISLPARGGFGLPTAYFLIQGLAIAAEHSDLGRRLGLGHGLRGRCFTLLVTAGPAFWLFHPLFITKVILPMLNAIGAT